MPRSCLAPGREAGSGSPSACGVDFGIEFRDIPAKRIVPIFAAATSAPIPASESQADHRPARDDVGQGAGAFLVIRPGHLRGDRTGERVENLSQIRG